MGRIPSLGLLVTDTDQDMVGLQGHELKLGQSGLISHVGALKMFPLTLRRTERLYGKSFFPSLPVAPPHLNRWPSPKGWWLGSVIEL